MTPRSHRSLAAATSSASSVDPYLTAAHAQIVAFARELSDLEPAGGVASPELERALDGVGEMYLATMTSLAQVVEAKDSTTRGHLDRTQAYGLALAARIDPQLAARPEVGLGFFLHDIGKVGIPEHVLRKTGPLTDAEWEIMRSHPSIGAEIVEPIRFLGEAVEIVRTHHERFDGAGYPQGLSGQSIPLAARIFSVVDSFDAMTSDRPYRRALPLDRALEEIRGGAGSQFDPLVVDAFLALVEEHDLLAGSHASSGSALGLSRAV